MVQKPTYQELEKQVKDLKEVQAALKKTESALRDSEQKYRKTFEAITDSITITRISDGQYLYVNDGFCTQTGYSREEVLGRRPSDINLYAVPDERDKFIGILKEYGRAENIVVTFRRKNGEIYYSEFSATPISYAGESCLLAQSRDITDRKKAEEALKISHERFLTVLDSLDATIYVSDMESNKILFMNKFMIDSFGRDMTGEICWKVFRGESEQCLNCTNDQLVSESGIPTGVCVWQGENPITKRWYINHDRAVEWTDGRLVRLQIATDITNLKKMEAQLLQAQKMESVGRLAGGVAHDFNNMLGIIIGNTEMIMDDMDSDNPYLANLQEIYKAAERSTRLTRQLLAFARKQTISLKVLNLNDTLEAMLTMLQRLIGEDINLAWFPERNLWPVKMDPSQVDQILANLCVNSRDAIMNVGKITIETGNVSIDANYCHDHEGFKPGDFVMISISDNGSGMDNETLDNLFEPFFTTKDIGQGTGLGLATVYGIIKQNNGFINVYSELGNGTTFKIYLPRYTTRTSRDETEAPVEQGKGGSETILLVEDEKAILAMTAAMLKRLGYHVLSASNPNAAIEIGKAHPGEIDLLLTDVIMPEMNGRDLAGKISELFPSLKCLFMSGYTANVIAHHGILDEGVKFISKPFSKYHLSVKIREALDE